MERAIFCLFHLNPEHRPCAASISERSLQHAHIYTRYDGFYDGPLAWRLIKEKALPPVDRRSKHDRDYYDAANKLQKKYRLPDHCTSTSYETKALAFVVCINLYLAQLYSPQDAVEYLIDLLPNSLEAQAYIFKSKYIDGHGPIPELMTILQECAKIVFDSQKAATSSVVTLADDADMNPFTLTEVAAVCGMNIKLTAPDIADPAFNLKASKQLLCSVMHAHMAHSRTSDASSNFLNPS